MQCQETQPETGTLVTLLHQIQFLHHVSTGKWNVKADSLSRIHSLDTPTEPAPILPPAVMVHPPAPLSSVLVAQDVIWYVCGSSPSGKVDPLPVPRRFWSHIGVDFVTDLPNSEGNTCILVNVDQFSKACHLIPLKSLSTSAGCLSHYVFRNHGIPEDTISNRGPQFISHVWKGFFKLLGVTVNLSSGYHPRPD